MASAENLPDFLGGTCTCEEFGGCMFSDRGPWNDYVMIQPCGIKRRAEIMDGNEGEEEEEKKQHE